MPFNLNDPSTWSVLIADDEPDSIGVIAFVCKFNRIMTRTAESGEDCLRLLNEQRADVLFLDVQMPVMSGWQVLSTIRATPVFKDMVVIATTAKAMMGDRERILEAGFDAYLSKPLSPATLIQDVTEVLRSKRSQIQPASDSQLPPRSVPPTNESMKSLP